MEPAGGPLSKWVSTPEGSGRKSGKRLDLSLNLNVLNHLPSKEEGVAVLHPISNDDKTPPAPRVKPLDLSKIDEIGRAPSPPRTLEIQRQRIIAKTTSLGNIKIEGLTRRPSIKGSPKKEAPLTLSGELKKGGLFFDGDLRAELERKLKEERHGPLIDEPEIEKIAKGFVHNCVDELFYNERHPEQFSLVSVRENIQEHAKRIHHLLITCQVLVSPLVEKLKFLKDETIKYLNEHNKKTLFSDNLLQYLNLLICTHKLEAFLEIYQKTTWDPKIIHLGEKACGDNVKVCVETWKQWLEPSKFQTLQSPFIHNVLDNLTLIKLPGKCYAIPQRFNVSPIIETVGCREIVRCFVVDKRLIFDEIIFVDTEELHFKKANLEKTEDYELEFFKRFFPYLYALGYVEGEHQQDAKYLIDFARLNWKPLLQYIKNGGSDFNVMQEMINLPYVNSRILAVIFNRNNLTEFNAESLIPAYFIPSLNVLQRASLTAWSLGHEFFVEKFKTLFSNPYWTRLLFGTRIEFKKNNYVVHIKSYGVGKRVSKDSTTFDPEFKQIKLQFKWHLPNINPPNFELLMITIPPEVNWIDKWNVIEGVIQTTADAEIVMKYVTDRLIELGIKQRM